MTMLQEIAILTELEMDIINFGEIKKENEQEPFECESDFERLESYHFFELQDKYSYGWYIAEQLLKEQIKSIEKFKLYIIDNYKED